METFEAQNAFDYKVVPLSATDSTPIHIAFQRQTHPPAANAEEHRVLRTTTLSSIGFVVPVYEFKVFANFIRAANRAAKLQTCPEIVPIKLAGVQ